MARPLAPSALRIPISRVRCDTVNDMSANVTAADSSTRK
jgi:hypothetical protein